MLSPTIEEHNIKQAMVNELIFLSKEANKAGNKSIGGVESIKDFFENYSTLPIKVIFTTQTRDEVINYLYGLDNNIDVIDYFYRIKTFVNTNSNIYKQVFEMLIEDDIVDVLLVDEYTKLDISTVEDIRKFYVLVLIYIYNNVIIVKDRK
jgi:hypothetical protein